MSVTAWYFLRQGPGDVRPLSRKAFEAFSLGKVLLHGGEDGFVRYVEVLVQLENRRAVSLASVGFFKVRVLGDGRVDPEHRFEVMAAASGIVSGNIPPRAGTPDIVNAEHRFAARRLDRLSRWEPEEADSCALRKLVNRRAGAVLL